MIKIHNYQDLNQKYLYEADPTLVDLQGKKVQIWIQKESLTRFARVVSLVKAVGLILFTCGLSLLILAAPKGRNYWKNLYEEIRYGVRKNTIHVDFTTLPKPTVVPPPKNQETPAPVLKSDSQSSTTLDVPLKPEDKPQSSPVVTTHPVIKGEPQKSDSKPSVEPLTAANRAPVLDVIRKNPLAFKEVEIKCKEDKQIAFLAVYLDKNNLAHVNAEMGEWLKDLFDVFRDGTIEDLREEESTRIFPAEMCSLKEYIALVVRINGKFLKDAPKFQNDQDIVREAIQNNPMALEFASLDLRNVLEIVSIATDIDPSALQFASDRLREDDNFVFKCVEKDGRAFEFASNRLKKDKILIKAALIQAGPKIVKFIPDPLKKDKPFVLELLTINASIMSDLPSEIKDDLDFVLAATCYERIKKAQKTIKESVGGHIYKKVEEKLKLLNNLKSHPEQYQRIDQSLQTNKAIAFYALKLNCQVWNYLQAQLKQDPDLAIAIVEKDPLFLETLIGFQDNKKVVLAAAIAMEKTKEKEKVIAVVSKNVSISLKNDPEVALVLLESLGPDVFESISERLKINEEFLLQASPFLRHDQIPPLFMSNKKFILKTLEVSDFYDFLPEILKKDEEVLRVVLKQRPELLKQLDPKQITRELILVALKSCGGLLEFFGAFKDDEQIVFAAVKNDSSSIKFASDRLKADRKFVRRVLRYDCKAILQHLKYDEDQDICLECIKIQVANFAEISQRLQNNRDFVLKAIKINPDVLEFVPDSFQADKGIVLEAFTIKPETLNYATVKLQREIRVEIAKKEAGQRT